MTKHCTFGRVLPKVFWNCTISLLYIFINIFPFQIFHSPALLFEYSDNGAFPVSNRQDICPACFHIITLFLFPYNLICVLSFVFRIYFNFLQNPGWDCAESALSLLKCKISPWDCAGFGFFLLKCKISTPDYAGFDFFLLKCKISTPDCAGFDFSGSKCKISTPDCAGFGFSSLNAKFQLQIVQDSAFSSLNAKFQPQIVQDPSFTLLKCKISAPDCAEATLSLLKMQNLLPKLCRNHPFPS